jgi:hypothetical protein
MNGFIQKIGVDLIVFEDFSAWRPRPGTVDLSHWSPLDPVEIEGPEDAARMTNMRTAETIIVAGSAVG